MAYDIGPRIGIDGEREYEEQIKNINQQMKTLDSQLQLTASEFGKETSAQDKAEAKTRTLTKQIELQEEKLKEQTRMLEESRKKTGDTSTQTQKYQEIVNKTQTELNKMRGELEKANTSTKSLGDSLKSAGDKMEKAGSKISKVGNTMSKYITTPLLAAGVASFKMASDLQENLNKTEVAFGSAADEVIDWSETTIDKFGLAQSSALEMASQFGDMATSMGLTDKEASGMSRTLVGLAADLASFKNISTDQAMTALNGIFTGESESLKRLGVVMTEATLKEYAMAKGIKKNYKEMTQAEKVNLRYQYVMEKTTNAQGDFARTSDGAANQMRMVKERVKQLGAEFGEKLLPVGEKILSFVNDLLDRFASLDDGTQQNIIQIGLFAAALGPVTSTIGKITQGIGGLTSGVGKLVDKFGEGEGGLLGSIKKVATSPAGFAALESAGLLALAAIGGEIVNLTTETGEIKKLHDEIQALAESFDQAAAARQRAMQESNAEEDNNQKLIDELNTLVDANGKVKKGYEDRVNYILTQLNGAYGIEANLVDGMIDKYDDFRDAVLEASDARRAQALLSSQEEAYYEALNNVTQAKKNMEEAEEALNDTHHKSMAEVARLNRAYETAKATYENYEDTIVTYQTAEEALRQGNYQEAVKISNSLVELDGQVLKSHTEAVRDSLETEQEELRKLEELYETSKGETTKAMIEAKKLRIAELKDELKTTSQLGEDFEKQFQGRTKASKLAGVSIVDGFVDGMSSRQRQLVAQARSMATQAINAFKAEYQIQSPSRVMRRLAEYAYEGWEIGSDRELPKLTSQSADMAASINQSFSRSFAMARTAQFSASASGGGAVVAESGVAAMKQALQGVKIVLDDEVAGRFVEKTVTDIVYS